MQRDGCSVIGTQIELMKTDWSLRSDNGTRMARMARMARRDGCSVIGTQIERIKADWSLRSDNGTRITRITRMARRDGCFGMERG